MENKKPMKNNTAYSNYVTVVLRFYHAFIRVTYTRKKLLMRLY